MQIGKYNHLKVIRKVEIGYYLDGQDEGEILLPNRYAPENLKVGDKIRVFIYLDSEDRLIATTEEPFAIVGEFAYLHVVEVAKIGAFLDWGLPKDLLVPFREQDIKMEEGKSYVVFLYIDTSTNRIAASSKLKQFLDHENVNYLPGDEVDIIVLRHSRLGYQVAINNRHEGMLYDNEVLQPLEMGKQTRAFVRKVRDDGKVDLRLTNDGYEKIDEIAGSLLHYLESSGGFMEVTDKSDPELIYNTFGISKKNFKKALGALYKSRQIRIMEEGIYLNSSD